MLKAISLAAPKSQTTNQTSVLNLLVLIDGAPPGSRYIELACPIAFRAEHAMEIGAHVRHAAHSAVPSGLTQYGIRLPTLKRWAILSSPSGTEEHPSFRCRKTFRMGTILSCTRLGLAREGSLATLTTSHILVCSEFNPWLNSIQSR